MEHAYRCEPRDRGLRAGGGNGQTRPTPRQASDESVHSRSSLLQSWISVPREPGAEPRAWVHGTPISESAGTHSPQALQLSAASG